MRREPPTFRRVTVARVVELSPRLRRVTLTGDELAGLPTPEPAASVRLLLPPPGHDDVVLPAWNGNEFLYDDGLRPHIRTLTPMRVDEGALEVDVDIVVHGHGQMSEWAATTGAGAPAGLAGTGRGHTIDPAATHHLIGGDESALPAIVTLLEVMPPEASVRVVVELAHPDGRLDLPSHPHTEVRWLDLGDGAPPGDALVGAITALDLAPDERVWVAGEAASVQRIRRHLFEELAVPRTRAVVRGYWKAGRGGDPDG